MKDLKSVKYVDLQFTRKDLIIAKDVPTKKVFVQCVGKR